MGFLRVSAASRIGVAGLCLILAWATAARAQTWLAPADMGVASLGPAQAKGAVIWSHGRSVNAEDFEAPTPPYIAMLRAKGWDVFRFNRMRLDDVLDASAAALVRQVSKLKDEGYRRIALAGQSFGAFLSLMAADTSPDVDVVIATAPAAFGRASRRDDAWRANATRLYPLLAKIRSARVMLFYFNDDPYDPGGRGAQSQRILADRHIVYVVVNKPPMLNSHWAASTPLFERDFGGCVLGFLDGAALAPHLDCAGDRLEAAPSLTAGMPASNGG